MILVVDDDRSVLELASEYLGGEGHEVRACEGAHEALRLLASHEPSLILSDVKMPGMDGIAFRAEYKRMFPFRQTPFVFFSSMQDEATVIQCLDSGADDYILKPIAPAILQAKVRAILRSRRNYAVPVFYGDVSRFPFERLMQFCEMKGLTGDVEYRSGGFSTVLRFAAGQLLETPSDELFESLYELQEGTFLVRAFPVGFEEMHDAAVAVEPGAGAEEPHEAMAMKDKPMGVLSGVKAESRLFQIQTEFVMQPERQIVTIVVLDGKVVTKKISSDFAGGMAKANIESLMKRQHAAMEESIRQKVQELLASKAAPREDDPKVRFNRLFEDGFEKYRARDLEGALALWEEAARIDPSNKTIETNVRMLSKKLGKE